MKCTYHPDVDTNLSCSNCSKPICPKEMVYTPAGIKCPDCARPLAGMRARGKPRDWLLAAGAGIGGAIGGGILLGVLQRLVPFGLFIVTLAYGFLMGELISWAARRNRGLYYQIVAGLTTLAGLGISTLVSLRGLSPFFLLAAVFAIGVAVARLRD